MFTPAELATMQQYGVIPPAVSDRMLDYAHIRYLLMFLRELVIAGSLWLVLQLKWAAGMRSFVESKILYPPVRVFVYCLILTGTLTVIRFPFNWYSGFELEHQFGLSSQSFLAWLGDLLKSKLLESTVLALSFGSVFWTIRRFPKGWPTLVWFILTALTALSIFVYPVLIDPLFNRITPMPDGELKEAIVTLASEAGVREAPVFIADRSKQTKKVNAQVTGLGSTARIVVWDTSLHRLPDEETRAMVAHELGHYVHRHILLGFGLIAAGLLILVGIAARMQTKLLAWLPKRWEITSFTDIAMIPALLLLGALGGFLLSPIENAVSRTIEADADDFALHLTQNRSAMARLFVSLSEENMSEPDPPKIVEFWFFSHPTLRDRIKNALGIRS